MVPFCLPPCSEYDEVETIEYPPKQGSGPSTKSTSPREQYGHPVHLERSCGKASSHVLPITSAGASPSCCSSASLALVITNSASCARIASWMESKVFIHWRWERRTCSSSFRFSAAIPTWLAAVWRKAISSGEYP